MNTTIALSNDDLLQETAARLVKTLGVEMAIFICRSNYWHGVLKLIQDQNADQKVVEANEPIRLHTQVRTPAQPDYADAQDIAIAA